MFYQYGSMHAYDDSTGRPVAQIGQALAHDTGKLLTAVIEDALRRTLARRATTKQTQKAGEAHDSLLARSSRPGVDLNDSAALCAFMERH